MEGQVVYIVDDDAHSREALRALMQSVARDVEDYASAEEFLRVFRSDMRGCLVLDFRMAGMTGLALFRTLKEKGSQLPVVFLTGYADVPLAVEALKEGAVDFVQKPYDGARLLEGINEALRRNRRDVRALQAGGSTLEEKFHVLTDREREIMRHLLNAEPSKIIARTLGISPRTVEKHRHNILKKLGVRDVSHLICMGVLWSA